MKTEYRTIFTVGLFAIVSSLLTAQGQSLNVVWALKPGDRAYLTTDNTQRGIAYNPATGHLLLVNRAGGLSVHVLDAATGADVGRLDVTGISGGTFALNMIGVGDDGVIYACNLTVNSTTSPFKVYRWANESAVPELVYSGDPSGGDSASVRFGDTLAVRGAGTGVQILAASRSGSRVALLSTTDGITFTAQSVVTDATAGDMGLGLAFGAGNTFWATASGRPVRHIDLTTGRTLASYGSSALPTTLIVLGVEPVKNLLAAINLVTGRDPLNLYDITTLSMTSFNAPVDSVTFPVDNANANGTGAIAFAGDMLFALDTNNGLMALRVKPRGAQFVSDFTAGLPTGTAVYGTARVEDGILKLTDAANAQAGTFIVEDLTGGQPVAEFVLEAKIRIGDSTCCTAGRNQLRPADGMSINFGPDITDDAGWSGGALEEGVGTGLRLTLDTWDSGDPDTAPAIELVYNNETKAVAYLDGWRDNNIPDAGQIRIDPQNGAPLTLYTDARDQTWVQITSGPLAGNIYQCHQGVTSRDIATLPGGRLVGPTVFVGLACDPEAVPPAPGPGYIALVERGACRFDLKGTNVALKGYVGMILFNHAAGGEDHFLMGGEISADLPAVMVARSTGLAIAGVSSADQLVVGNPGVEVAMVVARPRVAPWAELRWVLRPDGSSDVWWKGVKVLDNVATGYTPTAGRFGLGARTGGANESHWVDDLQIFVNPKSGPVLIAQEPADQTVAEGHRATFTVRVHGTPPFSVQWFSNNVPIPGANLLSYVTPPVTLDMSGVTYHAEISNAETPTPVATRAAVLTVQPAVAVQSVSVLPCSDHLVLVQFTKPVQLVGSYELRGGTGQIVNEVTYGADHTQVLLDTEPLTVDAVFTVEIRDEFAEDGGAVAPNPTVVQFQLGYGRFCADFNDGQLPPGTSVAGSAFVGDDGTGNPVLHLTDPVNGAFGALVIPSPLGNRTLDRLVARWKSRVGGGSGGADGYSFNWTPNLPNPPTYNNPGEEGLPTGLSVTVDTWDNGGGEAPGLEIRWNGTRLAFVAVPKDDDGSGRYLRKDQFVDAELIVTPTGQASFTYDGIRLTATLPEFAGIAGGGFVFGARTGGANDNHWIDDLCINNFTPVAPKDLVGPEDKAVVENDLVSFSVRVGDGLPPFSYQWFQNGKAIDGATGPTYSFRPTAADSGAKLAVRVSNECGETWSREATLTVVPALRVVSVEVVPCTDNLVRVLFTKPVRLVGSYTLSGGLGQIVNEQRYGATHSEVILETEPLTYGVFGLEILGEVAEDGSSLEPDPSRVQFSYGFGRFCADFNDNQVPPGAALGGTAQVGGPSGTDGILHLTDAGNNIVCGSLFIPNINGGAPLDRLLIRWKSRVGGGTGADGYSLSWGAGVPQLSGCEGTFLGGQGAEGGTGHGLAVTVDTYDNGSVMDPGGTGIEIMWKGARVAFAFIPKDPTPGYPTYLRKDTFVDAEVEVTPDGTARFTYDGVTISGPLPGFQPIAGNLLVAARTGGANDNHWIDDLCINGFPLSPPVITQEPADVTIAREAVDSATFVVGVDGLPPFTVQWYSNDVAVAGANTRFYTTPPLNRTADGARYKAVIANACGTVTSREAIVTVLYDAVPPTVTSAKFLPTLNQILVRFSEPMNVSTAQDPANYTGQGFNVTAAQLSADGAAVTLTLDQTFVTEGDYCLGISGVVDAAGNLISPDPTTVCVPLQFVPSFARQELWFGIGGVLLSDLTNNPAFPNSPSLVRYRPSLEANQADEFDNYGTRMAGWLKPPVTGNYHFAMASDDQGAFYLSTDATPAHLVLVAYEPQWNGRRAWMTLDRRNAAAPENRSSSLFPGGIPLVAGNYYYFEAYMKEGGGGDNLAVTWQIPGEPPISDSSLPIPGQYIYYLRDPAARITITQQPQDALYVIYPPLGGGAVQTWAEDFNAGPGGFTVESVNNPGQPWTWRADRGTWTASDRDDCAPAFRSSRLNSPPLRVSATGPVIVRFVHRYSFEWDGTTWWDGGQLRLSINGGPYTAVPASAFTENGYSGVVGGQYVPNNDLAGQQAFVAESPGYGSGTFMTSSANLGVLNEGDIISIQFFGAWDDCAQGPQPNWEIDSVEIVGVAPAQPNPSFTVGVEAVLPDAPSQPVLYQWQKNTGAGWVDIPGATGPTYSLVPLLADNGTRFRVALSLPTTPTVYSDEAVLTVVQANTPPRFTKGPDQQVDCSSGPVIVPGWATDIQPHSIPRAPVAVQADFEAGAPSGMALFGNARVEEGILKLTDAANSQIGSAILADLLAGKPMAEFVLEAKIRIGDSTCCTAGRNQLRPADGMSINFAPDIPDAPFGEDGVGSGLRLTLDAWDSGDPDTAPAIELVYNNETKAVAYLDGWRDNNIPDAGRIPIDPQNGAPLTLYTDARDQTWVQITSGPLAGSIYQCHQGATSRDIATLPDGRLAGPTVFVGLACDPDSVPPAPGPGYIALVERGACTFALKGTNVALKGYVGMIVFNHAAGGEDHFLMGGTISGDLPAVMVARSTGLAIAGVASADQLVVGNPGVEVALVVARPPVAPWAELRWVLRPDGSSDVWWKGVKVLDNVATGYRPTAGRFGFGARTGGANESHWVDDLRIVAYGVDASLTELGQTVQFIVSNNNPALFQQQPAIAPDGTLSFIPAPGQVGVAQVTVVAKDDGGTAYGGQDTSAPQSFIIAIVDTVPPSISCPPDMVVSASSADGAVVRFVATATDNCDPNPQVVCMPPSGSLFPIGVTQVQCVATDGVGHATDCSFMVEVRPPQASLDIKQAVLADLAAVRFSLPNEPQPPQAWVDSLMETKAMLSQLQTETRNVQITGADAAQVRDGLVRLVDSVQFKLQSFAQPLTLVQARLQLTQYTRNLLQLRIKGQISKADCDRLVGLAANAFTQVGLVYYQHPAWEPGLPQPSAVAAQLDKAIAALHEAADPAWWTDANHLLRYKGRYVFDREQEAVKILVRLIQDATHPIAPDVLQSCVDRLVAADRLLASVAIEDAMASGGPPNRIQEAQRQLANGDQAAARGDPVGALGYYKYAWDRAVNALLSLAPQRLADGHVQLSIWGQPGVTYTVQASTNLVDWVDIGTAQAGPNGEATFEDPAGGTAPRRFYRLVEP